MFKICSSIWLVWLPDQISIQELSNVEVSTDIFTYTMLYVVLYRRHSRCMYTILYVRYVQKKLNYDRTSYDKMSKIIRASYGRITIEIRSQFVFGFEIINTS